jgi:hypothetical protein
MLTKEVGWGAMLQARRPGVSPDEVIEFVLFYLIPLAA